MALRCYEAAVKFGVDIEKERESILQVLVGIALQKTAAEILEDFHKRQGETEKTRRWAECLADLEILKSRFMDKTNKLTKNAGFGPEMVANGLWILRYDEDHVFRREVLVSLGAARVFIPDIVGPVLEEAARNDPDQYVREASRNALTMVELPFDKKARPE